MEHQQFYIIVPFVACSLLAIVLHQFMQTIYR